MSDFLSFFVEHWREVLVLTREHMMIVLAATGLAVLIGLPLGILLTRIKSLQTPILGVANILQTVPSLALFGLLIPIPFIGGIGARTAVIALALYALLPVIRNTVTGILGIDPKVREAATAMGMTDGQILRGVELPLAAPVILTGIRVAVVISVGVATVAAAVGAGGLGTYIFRGLRQNDNYLLLAGALAAALLALLCDFVLGQVEKSYKIGERPWAGRKYLIAGTVTVFALIIGASYWPNFTSGGVDANALSANEIPTGKRIVVGSKDFTESVILAEILAQMLERQGVEVERVLELGGDLPHRSLLSGRIDVYPEYTGTAYTTFLHHPPTTDPVAVYDQTKDEYGSKFGFVLSPPLGFANDFAILVRGDVARANNFKTISEAVPISRNWQAGFGQDFMSRADGYPGFVKAYGFNFAKQPREMDLALTYRALQSGELDIIAGNSTDGLISALDLFQLEDDRRFFPPYQAVYIARKEVEDVLRRPFEMLANAISTEEMRRMNYEVDGKKRSPRDVAAEWVRSK
jgi:osmoprotectant transport system permease protein